MIAQLDFSTDTILGWSNNYIVDNIQFFETGIKEPWLYDYITSTPGEFDPNGFVLKNQPVILSKEERQIRVDQMNQYMKSLVDAGELTQYGFDNFLSETATNAFGYINGGNRFITWVKTINENGYNATLTGFKMHPEYRGENTGTLLNPVYPRADHLISILQS